MPVVGRFGGATSAGSESVPGWADAGPVAARAPSTARRTKKQTYLFGDGNILEVLRKLYSDQEMYDKFSRKISLQSRGLLRLDSM